MDDEVSFLKEQIEILRKAEQSREEERDSAENAYLNLIERLRKALVDRAEYGWISTAELDNIINEL